MSVYNGNRYLDECILSILNQTFKDFEFIIIDDCSLDNSLEILKKYQKLDSRIILIKNKRNIGLTKSLNRGIKKAKGFYIARQDVDDLSQQNRLKVQYNYLENNVDIFLVGSSAIIIDENGKETGVRLKKQDYKKVQKKLPKNNCIIHPAIMFRNDNNTFYREKFRYAQDYDLYLCLLTKGQKIMNLSEILLKYRYNTNTMTFSSRGKQAMFAEKARTFYMQRVNGNKDEYDTFNPKEIMESDTNINPEKNISESKLKMYFKQNKMRLFRERLKKHMQTYGFEIKWVTYYIVSFFPVKFIDHIRELVF